MSKPYTQTQNFWIFYNSFLSFTLAFCFGFILYDNDLRYVLYTRFPYNMKKLDDFCIWINEKVDHVEKNYLFFLRNKEMMSPEGYNKNMKKIKNAIFKTKEKEEESKEKHQDLVKEAKG